MFTRGNPRATMGQPAPSLFGRDSEQALLSELLSRAIHGHGSLVLVSGEAGIGKTALVEALAREASACSARVISGQCYDLTTTPPYGPWFDLAEDYQGQPHSLPIPASFQDEMALSALGGQVAHFVEMRQFFWQISSERPLLVVLEDMHWADQASLDLLRFMSRQLDRIPMLLVVTYRSDELSRRHALYQLLPLLTRESRPGRIEVHRLIDDDIWALVSTCYELGKADRQRLARYLQDHAQGNPFYIGELLRRLEDESLLTPTCSGWSLADLRQVYVPPLIHQVVDQRLRKLREKTREQLAVAAVIGQIVPLEHWLAVSNAIDADIESDIEQAIDSHILFETEDGTGLSFTHALVREVLYQGLALPRRRIHHRQIAEVLAETSGADPDIVAHHFQQAGDQRAADWLIRAGARAQRAYAWQIAAERFQSALAVLEGAEGTARQRGWLHYRIGRMLRFTDQPLSIAYYEDARRLAKTVEDQILAGFALIDSGSVRSVRTNQRRRAITDAITDIEAGIAELDAVSEYESGMLDVDILAWTADAMPVTGQPSMNIAGDRELCLGSIRRKGVLTLKLALTGRLPEARQVGESFNIDPLHVPEAIETYADNQWGLGIAYAGLGMPDMARTAFERAQDICRSINHHISLNSILFSELTDVILRFETDQIDKRWRIIEQCETLAHQVYEAFDVDDPSMAQRVPVLLVEGKWEEARQLVEAQDKRNQRGFHFPTCRFNTLVPLAIIQRAQGDGDSAWNIIRSGFPQGPETELGNVNYVNYKDQMHGLAVRLSIDDGDLTGARAWLETHDRWMEWSGMVIGRADGEVLWSEYYRAVGNPEAAQKHAEQALTLASSPRQPQVLIHALRLLGELATEFGDPSTASDHLQESLSLAEACKTPFERAVTLVSLAKLRLASRELAIARSLLDEAQAICTPMNAQLTLSEIERLRTNLDPQRGSTAYPSNLTTREVDVLRLVAEGLTDAEVGERLYVSRRTVTSHLTSIYTKLDVSSRTAATRVAIEQDLIEHHRTST